MSSCKGRAYIKRLGRGAKLRKVEGSPKTVPTSGQLLLSADSVSSVAPIVVGSTPSGSGRDRVWSYPTPLLRQAAVCEETVSPIPLDPSSLSGEREVDSRPLTSAPVFEDIGLLGQAHSPLRGTSHGYGDRIVFLPCRLSPTVCTQNSTFSTEYGVTGHVASSDGGRDSGVDARSVATVRGSPPVVGLTDSYGEGTSFSSLPGFQPGLRGARDFAMTDTRPATAGVSGSVTGEGTAAASMPASSAAVASLAPVVSSTVTGVPLLSSPFSGLTAAAVGPVCSTSSMGVSGPGFPSWFSPWGSQVNAPYPSQWAQSPVFHGGWQGGMGVPVGQPFPTPPVGGMGAMGTPFPPQSLPPPWGPATGQGFYQPQPASRPVVASLPVGPLHSDIRSLPAGEPLSSASEEETVSEEEAPPSFSFREAISCLAAFAPESVTSTVTAPPLSLSAADKLLGVIPSRADSSPRLKESALVTGELASVQAVIRGGAEAPKHGCAVGFRSALNSGRFLKPGTFLLRNVVGHEEIPGSAQSLSDDDGLLLPEGLKDGLRQSANAKSQVTDKTLADLEELARRSLVATSVLDSFLGGLVAALKDPSQESFAVRGDVDAPAVATLVRAMSGALKSSANSASKSLVNTVLARRDGLLASSLASQQSRKNLRAVPLDPQSSMFSGHVGPTLDKQAETDRTLSTLPRPQAVKRAAVAPASFPPSNKKKKEDNKSGGWRKSKGTGQKGQKAKKPSAPKPPPQ